MKVCDSVRSFRRNLAEKALRLGMRTTSKLVQQFGEPVEPPDSLRFNADLYDSGRHSAFEGAPDVALQKPLVMVPGFRAPGDCFYNWANTLTRNGQNGGHWYLMEDGNIFDSSNLDQPVLFPHPDAKVFLPRFKGNVEPPDTAGEQLGRYLEQVAEATAQPDLDVAAYSMGGLAARSYLDNTSESKIDRLLQLGTPNNGSEMGRMATLYLEERSEEYTKVTKWERKTVAPRDLEAAKWLIPVEEGNVRLQDLNSRWPQQREKLNDFRVVGSGAKRTLSPGLRFRDGDGLVHKESLALSGEQPVFLADSLQLDHDGLVNSTEGFVEAQKFFGWQLAEDRPNSEDAVPEKPELKVTYPHPTLF